MLHSIWIIPIAVIVNFIVLPIALHYFTDLSFSDTFLVSLVWLFFQPIYCLLLVRLWDLAAYSMRNLRMCTCFTFRKELMGEMIELRKDILSHVSAHLLKAGKTLKE